MRRLIISLIFLFAVFNSVAGMCGDGEDQTPKDVVLYIYAHQDDELGAIARMAYEVHEGKNVHAIWITDGARAAPADIREVESRNAMKAIGVTQENIYFLGYPDSLSFQHLDEIFEDVSKIVKEISPVEITSIAYEGGNIDHDVTPLIASSVIKKLGIEAIHYEFPLYKMYKNNYVIGKFIPYEGAETKYQKLNRKLVDLKIEAFDFYPSQAYLLNMLKAMANKKSLKKGEPYRVAPEYNYLKPPVEGKIGYEAGATRAKHTFDEWLEYVGPFLEKINK